MAVEKKFIAANIKRSRVKDYLKKELERTGFGGVDIQRTPLGTRIIVHAQKPGLVIGRRGASIMKLTDELREKYDLDNPQIEVNEVDVPELNAHVMAKNIAALLERGFHFRRAAYTMLRRIMGAGARGVQIEISGKLTGERSRREKFVEGYIKHCGEPAELYVQNGFAVAALKPGVIGVKVKIMPPGIRLPDDIEFIEPGEMTEEVKPEEDEPKKPAVKKKAKKATKATKKVAEKKTKAVKKKAEVKEPKPKKVKEVEEAEKAVAKVKEVKAKATPKPAKKAAEKKPKSTKKTAEVKEEKPEKKAVKKPAAKKPAKKAAPKKTAVKKAAPKKTKAVTTKKAAKKK